MLSFIAVLEEGSYRSGKPFENMDLQVILLLVAGLLIAVALTAPLADRLGLSPTVLLALVGIAIGLTSMYLMRAEGLGRFASVANVIVNLPVHPDAFLYIFLPILVFDAALNIEVRRMMEDAAPILLLAVVAVLVATVAIGAALIPMVAVPATACFMLGSIVATTDPVAVIAIFRDVGAPSRLNRLVEGESLLNDAVAITLFVMFMGTLTGGQRLGLGAAAVSFVRSFAGGIAVGYIGARLIAGVLRWLLDMRLAQVTLTLALPYLVYIVAERQLGVSGVVATLTSGLVMSAMAQRRMSPDDWHFLHELWEQLAFWASSLIFVFASLLVPRMLFNIGWHDMVLLAVLIGAAMLARAVVVFGLLPLMATLHLSQTVNNRFKAVILWGGLRGALTLVLALSVTENTKIAPDVQRFVAILATGFVLFTLLVNGTTLRLLIRLVGLDRLSTVDQALRDQVLRLSRDRISDTVKTIGTDYEFPDALISDVIRNRAVTEPDLPTDGGRCAPAMPATTGSSSVWPRSPVTSASSCCIILANGPCPDASSRRCSPLSDGWSIAFVRGTRLSTSAPRDTWSISRRGFDLLSGPTAISGLRDRWSIASRIASSVCWSSKSC